jgi:hypothetical protein
VLNRIEEIRQSVKSADSIRFLITMFSLRTIFVFTATNPPVVLHGRLYLFGHSEIYVTEVKFCHRRYVILPGDTALNPVSVVRIKMIYLRV